MHPVFRYTSRMGLYWKDLEILPGMLLEVELYHHDATDSAGNPVSIRWEILAFDTRKEGDAYFEHATGKKYPLKRVLKSRRLQGKLKRAELLQLPAGSDFMVVEEYHDGKAVFKRCYNLDMLAAVRNIRPVAQD